MVYQVYLSSTEDANRVNEVACQQTFDMSISYGADIVDAKSLIALYPFVGKEVFIVVPDEINEKYFRKIIKRMGF